jgi:hypothetical protein
MEYLEFESWSDAFDCCRERGHPLVVCVGVQCARIFPSGVSISLGDVEEGEDGRWGAELEDF